MHKSGFVNIVGKPNAGKSTLMNIMLGERLSIINRKPQTTRHRIFGLWNEEDFQVVFSDTPGIIDKPGYGMQKAMNNVIMDSFEDADLVLYILDAKDPSGIDEMLKSKISHSKVPAFLVVNKSDLIGDETIDSFLKNEDIQQTFAKTFFISALYDKNIDILKKAITDSLPEGPEYFPKDQLSDKPERFFVTEIIREKILEFYEKEIPYSCEVVIDNYKEPEENAAKPVTKIRAIIYVNRDTQKNIIIGKGGEAIKKLGIASRSDIEKFINTQVFLELFVKVKDNWRNDERVLRHFGYQL